MFIPLQISAYLTHFANNDTYHNPDVSNLHREVQIHADAESEFQTHLQTQHRR